MPALSTRRINLTRQFTRGVNAVKHFSRQVNDLNRHSNNTLERLQKNALDSEVLVGYVKHVAILNEQSED